MQLCEVGGMLLAEQREDATTVVVLAICTHCTVCVCVPTPQLTEQLPKPSAFHCTQEAGMVQLCVEAGFEDDEHREACCTAPVESWHCTVSVCVPLHEQADGFEVTHVYLAAAFTALHTPEAH